MNRDADSNKENNGGNTALMLASMQGYKEIVELLINRTLYNINKRNKYGNTALILAGKNNHT
jgi:ankyrin repeat protein